MFFEGESSNTIDDKGRLVVPAKFREGLGQKFVLVKGLDKCVYMYTTEKYEELNKRLSKMDPMMPEARTLARHFCGSKQDAECDKQGRVLVDQMLRDYANLRKDIYISGAIDRVEIWDTEEFKNYERENEDIRNKRTSALDEAVRQLPPL